MLRVLAIVLVLGLCAAERRAEAAPVRDHPFYIAVVSIGFAGGIGNTVAAIVYAAQGRSFHAPWIGTTLLSSAICGSFAGQLMVDAANGEGNQGLVVTGIVGFLIISLWPAAWVTVSALADVPLGSKFDAEVAPEETDDPIEALVPSSTPPLTMPLFSWSF